MSNTQITLDGIDSFAIPEPFTLEELNREIDELSKTSDGLKFLNENDITKIE